MKTLAMQDTDTPRQRPFPLFPLVGAGSLILISLLSVAWVRWSGGPEFSAVPTPAHVIAALELNFQDMEDGSVGIFDATTGEQIRLLPPGEHGFVRATLRGLARARRAIGAGAEMPFYLEQRQSGQLVLIDPVTSQEIDLWAFGSLNGGEFASLFDPDSPANMNPKAAPPAGPQVVQSNNRSPKP